MDQRITHHIPDELLIAYVAGRLDHAYSVVVAAHLEMCPTCRAAAEAHSAVGGAVLNDLTPCAIAPGSRDKVMAGLDAPMPATRTAAQARGVYPGPVIQAMKRAEPKWRSLGFGVKQSILYAGREGSLRLLYIPAGQAVPDHGHNGLELTLVLQGAFRDEEGAFGVGDLEVGDSDLEHTPVAEPGEDCICLAATDAPLRFKSFVPRVFQPVFRI